MKTSENRLRRKLHRWAMPAAVAVAMMVLPGVASTAEAHGRQHGRHMSKAHGRGHYQGHRVSRHGHRHGQHRGHKVSRQGHRHGQHRGHKVSRHGHGYGQHRGHRVSRHGHSYGQHRGHRVGRHSYRRFSPVHVSYYRPRAYRPVSFYLETPYVVVHGPRVDARVVYYPGDVALYEPGYCPSDVHYHPYENDRIDIRARVNVHLGF